MARRGGSLDFVIMPCGKDIAGLISRILGGPQIQRAGSRLLTVLLAITVSPQLRILRRFGGSSVTNVGHDTGHGCDVTSRWNMAGACKDLLEEDRDDLHWQLALSTLSSLLYATSCANPLS